MKKVFLLFCLFLGSVFAFTACDDDDDDNSNTYNNTVEYDGDSFKIKEVFVDYDGQYKDYENLDRLDIDFELERNGLVMISLVVKKGNKTPVAGTYTFDANATQDMRIFRGFYENDEDDIDVKSGTCVVSVSGSTYTFDFNLVLENNKTVVGNYKGTIKENIDEIPEDEGELSYNGTSYEIKGATVEYDEVLGLTIANIDFDMANNIEAGLMLIVSEGENRLVAGTYNVHEDDSAIEPMLVYRAWFEGQGDDVGAESGTCTVSISDTIYTLIFEFEMTNGKELKGYYKGQLSKE